MYMLSKGAVMGRIDKAFQLVNRKNFLPPDVAKYWRRDTALPIGYDQTISQPYTVRKMLEWLDVQEGDRVLDLGSGSGWTTALLAHIVGKDGRVYAVERIPELVEFGRGNCIAAGIIKPSRNDKNDKKDRTNSSKGCTLATEKMLHSKFPGSDLGNVNPGNLGNVGVVSFHQAGEEFGLPSEAPYDRILVSASADKLPETLLGQLKIGGKMVIPVSYDILEIAKKSQKDVVTTIHSGFIFVPLVSS